MATLIEPWERNPDDMEPCPGCGDGDRVPPGGYFHCPVCDAEWDDEAPTTAQEAEDR